MKTQTLLTWISGALLAIPSLSFALSSAPTGPALNLAGKGTIGIVCQSGDGMIQAVQPLDIQSLQEDGAAQAIQQAEDQIQAQGMSQDQVESMDCGVQVIDPGLLKGMPPQAIVTPPSGEGPILPLPAPISEQSSGSGE